MPTDPHARPHPLPDAPNLRHLKDQAKDLVRAGTADSIAHAQYTNRTTLRISELAEA